MDIVNYVIKIVFNGMGIGSWKCTKRAEGYILVKGEYRSKEAMRSNKVDERSIYY